jgi:hypothetical protein
VATFELATVSGVLGMLAVGGIDPGLLAWPGYLTLANGLTAGVIVARRRAGRARPRIAFERPGLSGFSRA